MRSIVAAAIGLVLLLVTPHGANALPPETNVIASNASGNHGAVAAGNAESVAAGLEILRNGGNAADAAVATILALTVTDSTNFCFGGEVAILYYDASRKVVESVCGLGVAPQLATRDYFVAQAAGQLTAESRQVQKPGGIPPQGILSAAPPAVLDACVTLLGRYGTRKFEDVVAPTLRILDQHKVDWHPRLARTLRRLVDAERSDTKDRIRGLRLVADYFYRGPIAREITAWSIANNGLIRYSDLATHVTRIEEPASVDYRGYTVFKCGPWTQGPYLLQTLRLLEHFDLKQMGHNRPQTIHTTIEAMKLAFADRDVYYGDPLFVDVPLTELLSTNYAKVRFPLIDPDTTSLTQRPGDPRNERPLLSDPESRRGLGGTSRDTTTCVVADQWGNVIATTPSGWNGVEAGETGVWLGTRLQSFNLWEGHPNCIEPGKRPRITLTPTLVLKDHKPTLAVSVAGGDAQDQASIQLVINHIDFAMNPSTSMDSFRFGTDHFIGSFRQTPPELGSLLLSPDTDASVAADLSRRGHLVQETGHIGSSVVIAIDPTSGKIEGAGERQSDKRVGAY
ncbi:MAG: gamma-glutamyltransferase [Planctomycetota bacterium]|nr:gamma-glutamyltransferase [Planctomycetota bacterium]